MKRSTSILLSAVLMSFTMALGGCSDSTTRAASGSDFQRSQPIELRQGDDGLVTVMAVNETAIFPDLPNRSTITVESRDPWVAQVSPAEGDGAITAAPGLTARNVGHAWMTVKDTAIAGERGVVMRFKVDVVSRLW